MQPKRSAFHSHLEATCPALADLDILPIEYRAMRGYPGYSSGGHLKKPLIATTTGGLGEGVSIQMTGLQVATLLPGQVARAVLD